MKPLYTKQQFNFSKSTDLLPCKCYHCNETFYKKKKYIKHEIKSNKGEVKYCSHACKSKDKITTQIVFCNHCDKEFEKQFSQIKKIKSISVLILVQLHSTININLVEIEGQNLKVGLKLS